MKHLEIYKTGEYCTYRRPTMVYWLLYPLYYLAILAGKKRKKGFKNYYLKVWYSKMNTVDTQRGLRKDRKSRII